MAGNFMHCSRRNIQAHRALKTYGEGGCHSYPYMGPLLEKTETLDFSHFLKAFHLSGSQRISSAHYLLVLHLFTFWMLAFSKEPYS